MQYLFLFYYIIALIVTFIVENDKFIKIASPTFIDCCAFIVTVAILSIGLFPIYLGEAILAILKKG